MIPAEPIMCTAKAKARTMTTKDEQQGDVKQLAARARSRDNGPPWPGGWPARQPAGKPASWLAG